MNIRASNGDSTVLDIALVVTDPNGPRARIGYPPFPEMVPLVRWTVIGSGTTAAVRLEVDCGSHPDAAEFLRGVRSGGGMYAVSASMRAHPSGNGYVILRVSQDEQEHTSTEAVETVLDPVEHRAAIEALKQSGQVLVVSAVAPGEATRGILTTFDPARLQIAEDAALSHPRRVQFK